MIANINEDPKPLGKLEKTSIDMQINISKESITNELAYKEPINIDNSKDIKNNTIVDNIPNIINDKLNSINVDISNIKKDDILQDNVNSIINEITPIKTIGNIDKNISNIEQSKLGTIDIVINDIKPISLGNVNSTST